MRKITIALLTISAMIIGFAVLSCGETDPATAPAGATISIVGSSEIEGEYLCDSNTGLPAYCFETYLYVKYALGSEELPDKFGCLAGGGTADECAKQYIEQQPNGYCGGIYSPTSIFVTAPTYGVTGESQSGAEGGTTGGAILGAPMNDVQVLFYTSAGMDLYGEFDDVNDSKLDPLGIPYETRTGDRGNVNLQYVYGLPTICGVTSEMSLTASITVSEVSLVVIITVSEVSDEGTTDDDDSAE